VKREPISKRFLFEITFCLSRMEGYPESFGLPRQLIR
jgi:hypothetical protein